MGNADYRREKRLDNYRRALQITWPLLSLLDGGLDVRDVWYTTIEQQKNIVRNNIIYYIVDYLRLGGEQAERDELGIVKEKVADILAELNRALPTLEDPMFGDTVRYAAGFFGDKAMACRAAERVLTLLREQDWSFKYSAMSINEMKNDAEKELLDDLEGV